MKPHLEAVLTTRRTLPFSEGRSKGLPVSVGERWAVSWEVLCSCGMEDERRVRSEGLWEQ